MQAAPRKIFSTALAIAALGFYGSFGVRALWTNASSEVVAPRVREAPDRRTSLERVLPSNSFIDKYSISDNFLPDFPKGIQGKTIHIFISFEHIISSIMMLLYYPLSIRN